MRLISDEAVELVIHLKASTALSETKIAKAAKISRGSVKRIIDGELFHKPKVLKQRLPNYRKGKRIKCPVCGVVVIVPCLVCALHGKQEAGTLPVSNWDWREEELTLDLEESHVGRFEEIVPVDSIPPKPRRG